MNSEFSYNYGDCYSNDKFVRMRFNIVKDLLLPYIKNDVKMLDIGCYDGSMLKVFKNISVKIDYIGVDADLLALGIASARGAKTAIINFETAELPFEDNSFDIIIMAEILEHLRNPAKIMKKAKALLKSTGVILISLPNECTIYHRIKMLLGRGIDGTGFEPGYHLHFPTLKQNDEFILKYFKITEKKYWYHLGVEGVLGRIIKIIPGFVARFFVKIWPTLFARGGIYLCQK